MKLYEYQAKQLFEEYGIPTSPGRVAVTPDEAFDAARKLGGTCIVKAQVLVGGRGKAGGVKLASTPEEAKIHASQILGMKIKSLPVKKVLITRAEEITREYYVGFTVDRSSQSIALIASAAGGIDIEELANDHPEKILTLPLDPLKGFDEEACLKLLSSVFEEPVLTEHALATVHKLYRLFVQIDASLIEINPYALLKRGTLLALDAKIVIDENGVFKHPSLEKIRNREEYGPDELEAREYGLSFVNMDGTIGCIVNGAGLAMATMDIIKLFGGTPANFLDVGGSSSPEKVLHAFEIISHNKKVKALLINIFGGITRCDDIAKGILQAKDKLKFSQPLVIRLIGTNEKEGRAILKGAGIEVYEDLPSAVQKVVQFS
jgi:succinyl-CoA synthetase beta subunit